MPTKRNFVAGGIESVWEQFFLFPWSDPGLTPPNLDLSSLTPSIVILNIGGYKAEKNFVDIKQMQKIHKQFRRLNRRGATTFMLKAVGSM